MKFQSIVEDDLTSTQARLESFEERMSRLDDFAVGLNDRATTTDARLEDLIEHVAKGFVATV